MTESLADPPPPSADLSSLFTPSSPGVRFGQGMITAWDPATGQNTIEWSGGTLTDVPVLNTGEAIALRPGRVVGMLGQGLTWFIIGRITPPNDPDFASASVGFSAENGQATAFAVGTTLATKSSCTLDVPVWADEVAIIAVGACTLVNTTATADFASCAVFIDGVTGPGIQMGYQATPSAINQHLQAMTVSSARVYPVAGGATILCEMQIRAVTAWAAHASNIAEISAIAIFRSTV